MKQNIIVEKTFAFPLTIIHLYKRLQADRETVISKQLLRSGTSIRANVEESTAGQTKKDFITKMSIASKEARGRLSIGSDFYRRASLPKETTQAISMR